MDHKKAANPFKSRYGDKWYEVIKNTTYMSNYVSVHDLLIHIAVETDEMMEGTRHEKKGLLKHDPMTLITASETIAWMKTYFVNGRTIYSRWVLPEAGLNDKIEVNGKITTRYRGRPPDNLPRTIGLDGFANKNAMGAVNHMISATKRLERGPDPATDPKFEFCDRVRASRAFLRCWDPAHGPKGGAPTGETIVAGHERVWGKHLGEIRMAQGRMVGTRIGHPRSRLFGLV